MIETELGSRPWVAVASCGNWSFLARETGELIEREVQSLADFIDIYRLSIDHPRNAQAICQRSEEQQ